MHQLELENLHVLLIEPSDTQAKIIRKYLEAQQVTNISHVSSLALANSYIAQDPPDLVISAMHMPDGDSISLVKSIKHSDNDQHISFMLVSSEDRLSKLEEYKQSGVIAILPKPFTDVQLKRALNATLQMLNTHEIALEAYDIDSVQVLVVDDSALARNHISRVLTTMGLQHIVHAQNGSEALTLIKEQNFDLVVTDYNMPEMDGRELSEFIRFNPATAHIPIIMVTSESADSPQMSNIQQTGVNALCDKPFAPEEVKRMLVALLSE